MKISRLGAVAASWCLLSVTTTSALAHHSFAMFDMKQSVTLDGTVREVQWTNPHIFIQLTVLEQGKVVEYSIEGHSPNGLIRMGWKKNSLKAGDKVKMTIAPLKDGTRGGTVTKVVFPDGTTLGWSG